MRKTIILVTLFVFGLILAGANITGSEKTIIYSTAATTTNDTLSSGWVYIGSSQNVALFYNTDDTSYVKGQFDYRYGQFTEIANVAADTLSLDTRSSAAAGLSKGKILRGYGLAADLIPGANWLKVTLIWKAGSETTTTIQCGLIME